MAVRPANHSGSFICEMSKASPENPDRKCLMGISDLENRDKHKNY